MYNILYIINILLSHCVYMYFKYNTNKTGSSQ